MSRNHSSHPTDDSRREFIRGSSLLLASALPRQSVSVQSLRLGLIGCGRRGQILAGAAISRSADGVALAKLVAVADILPNRMQQAVRGLKSRNGPAFEVMSEGRFSGVDCHRKLIASQRELGLNAVIIATPVAMRASIAHAAALAGLHSYMEQPIAYDQAGVHRFVEAVAAADRNCSLLVVGNRHDLVSRHAALCKALRTGIIGDPLELNASLAFAPGAGLPARVGRNVADEATPGQRPSQTWEHLESSVAVLELAQAIFQQELLPAVANASTCSGTPSSDKMPILFQTPAGQRLVIHQGGKAAGNLPVSKLLLKGSAGSCDLVRGVCWDDSGGLLASLPPQPVQRTLQLEQALEGFAAGLGKSVALEAIKLNHLAIQ